MTDSTGEYVRGRPGEALGSIYKQGLQCVTVLIGLFDRHSGLPVGGIINQPFAAFSENKKRCGSCYSYINRSY